MIKKEKTYYLLLGLLTFGFVIFQLLKPVPLDWTESFSSDDKIPYGGYIIHQLIDPVISNHDLSSNTSSIFESGDSTDSRNWIFINTDFSPDELESKLLLKRVKKGAHIFIAARTFQGFLSDTLNLNTSYGNPFLGGGSIFQDDTSYVRFANPNLQREGGWPYADRITKTYFSSVDSARTTILGTNDNQQPNFIKMKWGDGGIFIHSNPTLFTNYFVRDSLGAEYALTALSYLPPKATVWDEYYKAIRTANSSPLRYVVSQKYLKWAWFVSLSGILLFMIFRAKRKQRIIPVLDPPINSSIEFAHTIGNLYLEKGDHKLISEKKIIFFRDYIRSNLGLDTARMDDTLIKDVANRSGIAEEEIGILFDVISNTSQKKKVTQHDLKLLTERIDRFYNNSQR